MNKTIKERRERAEDYFHSAPCNWNCAQAIHKVTQEQTGLTDEEIELRYRSKGGGRAEGGLCGAIYAVRTIVGEGSAEAERMTAEFGERAGALTCRELKGELGVPCPSLVALAQEILEQGASTNNEEQDHHNR